MYALIPIDMGHKLLLFNRLDIDSYGDPRAGTTEIRKSPDSFYKHPIGKAKAKIQVRGRNEYFRECAWNWGCGTQDHFGEVTEMIADEAGLDNKERYAGLYGT